MVNGVHFNYDGIEIGHKTVLFLDIITYAAERQEDCLHKRRTEDPGRTQSIQKNLKLWPHRQPNTHKIKKKSSGG